MIPTLLFLATFSCGGEGPSANVVTPSGPAAVARVDVSPLALSLIVGATSQLTASTFDANGTTLGGRTVSFASSDNAVATASSSGLVTAVAPGNATITASSEGRSGTAVVTVTRAPVSRVSVSPAAITVAVGAASQLTATALGAAGDTLSGRVFTWTSSNPAIATVSTSGLVTGVVLGGATLSVSSEGQTAQVAVTVTRTPIARVSVSPAAITVAIGAASQLTATALGAAGDTLSGRVFTWTPSNPAIATASTSGLVTGVAAGSATVSVASEGQTAQVAVTVLPANTGVPGVASVLVSPGTAQLAPGATVQLSASALDSLGATLAGKTFSFVSSNNAVATVSATGLVTAVSVGTAVIAAATDGKQGTALVTVNAPTQAPGPIARISLQPAAISMPVRGQDQLTAVGLDSAGRPVTGATYTFTTSAAAVATVTSTGVVNAVSSGTATITATAAGKFGTALITVTAAANGSPVRVAITPATASVAMGSTVQLTGAAYDAQGRVSTLEAYLWLTGNATVATVTPSGLVTAVNPGTAQISMSSGGQVGNATVTVTSPVAASNVVDVNPSISFQTITGWQGASANGWWDCNATAFARYKDPLHDRLVTELGIDRVTIGLRSGMENSVDYWGQYVAGTIDQTTWRNSWYLPINDNNDPFVTDSTKFHFGFLDGGFDNAILPLRQRLAARGERLYVVLSYVDFTQGNTNKPFLQMQRADEYAEFVTMAFIHLKQKYGFVPDALEIALEPEHTPYTPADMGRAMVATVSRLRAKGFNPDILAPSTTSMYNASTWYDQMLQVPGTRGLITELAYHRYVAVSYPALAAIGLRAQRDGVKTSMLEHIGSGFAQLYEDLTVANVSSWQQFSNAFCGLRDNPDNQGVYYQINQTDPNNPRINITRHSQLLRQVFAYVRRGAVRLGATSGNFTDLLPLAFKNANGKMVAVVWAQRGASFTVRGLPAGTYGINYGTSGTAYNMNLSDQTIGSGGTIQTSIPTAGVITIYAR